MSEESSGDFQKSRHRGGTLIPCTPDSTSPRDHTHNRPEKNVIVWKWEEQPGGECVVFKAAKEYQDQVKSKTVRRQDQGSIYQTKRTKKKVTSICFRIQVCF